MSSIRSLYTLIYNSVFNSISVRHCVHRLSEYKLVQWKIIIVIIICICMFMFINLNGEPCCINTKILVRVNGFSERMNPGSLNHVNVIVNLNTIRANIIYA